MNTLNGMHYVLTIIWFLSLFLLLLVVVRAMGISIAVVEVAIIVIVNRILLSVAVQPAVVVYMTLELKIFTKSSCLRLVIVG